MPYESIVTLGNAINRDGTLTEDVRLRVERSIDLVVTGDEEIERIDWMVMSGSYHGADRNFPVTQAEAMKRYALEKALPSDLMPPEKVLTEEKSRDTVGEAFFVKRDIALPRKWSRIIVVSSEYHMPRVKAVFDFIFGSDFNLAYRHAAANVNPQVGTATETEDDEKKRLMVFTDFWKGLRPGDDARIAEKQFTDHPLYKGAS